MVFENIPRLLDRLVSCIKKRLVCAIHYKRGQEANPVVLHVIPGQVKSYNQGLYLHGWIGLDSGTIHNSVLALHRMDYVEPTGRVLTQFEWDDLPTLMDDVFIGLADADAPFKAKIRFTGLGAAHIRERVYSYNQTISTDKDRSIIWEGVCQSEMEVIRWVRSCGHDAELLSPEPLRLKVAEVLKASTLIYENEGDNERSSGKTDRRVPPTGGSNL